MKASRTFRLFISSTFSDFLLEREALRNEVFPRLERYCADRGARFLPIDLRWGITAEAAASHDTLRICLEEVRRCQEMSPAPNFAVLLGNRYGWEPPPARIPQPHWQQLIAAANPSDRRTIRSAYQGPDRNAVPPAYLLRPRHGDWKDDGPREAAVRNALRRAFDAAAQPEAERTPYFTSATHQEIVQGALAAKGAEQHVHVYQREIVGLPQGPEEDERVREFIDTDPHASAPGAAQRLAELVAQLARKLPAKHVHPMQATWVGGEDGISREHLPAFCEAFYEHQRLQIDAALSDRNDLSDAELRDEAACEFAGERSRVFVGRRATLRRMERHLQSVEGAARSQPRQPLVLLAEGGAGKSAVMSRSFMVARHRSQGHQGGPRPVVMARFIGAIPGTESLLTMLTDLVADLAQAYGQHPPEPPPTLSKAAEDFAIALTWATQERPLHLFLDALDQLAPADQHYARHLLSSGLPPHARLIVSVRSSPAGEVPAGLVEATVHRLPAMTPADGRLMIAAWLKQADESSREDAPMAASGRAAVGHNVRKLSSAQTQYLLADFAANPNPLWLRLAVEEAASWKSSDKPCELPASVEGLVERLLQKTLIDDRKHPPVFTERALAYLAAARHGLAEQELARALGTDEAVREEFKRKEQTRIGWSDPLALPPILWARLSHDLKPYLTELRVDGARVMRFFHREFHQVVSRRLLGGSDGQKTHRRLADTFEGLSPDGPELFRRTDASTGSQQSPALRRVMEQPWQLARAADHRALKALLTDFGFLMAKCAAGRVNDLIQDLLRASPDASSEQDEIFLEWQRFLLANAHILRRGLSSGTAGRLLFSQAINSDQGTASLRAAERFVADGYVDWLFLRGRPAQGRRLKSSMTFEVPDRHKHVMGALPLGGNKLLAWYGDGSVTLWDCGTGDYEWTKTLHRGPVLGVLSIGTDRFVSFGREDPYIRLWTKDQGDVLVERSMTTERLVVDCGVVRLDEHRIASWSVTSKGNSLTVWQLPSLTPIARGELPWHVRSCVPLGSSKLLLTTQQPDQVWSLDLDAAFDPQPVVGLTSVEKLEDGRLIGVHQGRLTLWDSQLEAVTAEGPKTSSTAEDAALAPDGRVILDGGSGRLLAWEPRAGSLIRFALHDQPIRGHRSDGANRWLTWSRDGTARLWDVHSGREMMRLPHKDWVNGAFRLDDERLVTWCDGEPCQLWRTEVGASADGQHDESGSSEVKGAIELDPRRLLLWGGRAGLCAWDVEAEAPMVLPEPLLDVSGAAVLQGATVVVWDECALQVRDWQTLSIRLQVESPKGYFAGALPVDSERVLTWADGDPHLRLWSIDVATECGRLELGAPVRAVTRITQDRTVAWLADRSLLLLTGDGMQVLCALPGPDEISILLGHGKSITWAMEVDVDRLVSWSQGEGRLVVWDLKDARFVDARSDLHAVVPLGDGWMLLRPWQGPPVLWHVTSGNEVATSLALDDPFDPPTRVRLRGKEVLVCDKERASAIRLPAVPPVQGSRVLSLAAVAKGRFIQVSSVAEGEEELSVPAQRPAEWHHPSLKHLLFAWPDGRFLVDAGGPMLLRLFLGQRRCGWI